MSRLDKIDIIIDWSDASAPKVVVQGVSMACESIDDARFVSSLLCEMRDRLSYFRRVAEDVDKSLGVCKDEVASLLLF